MECWALGFREISEDSASFTVGDPDGSIDISTGLHAAEAMWRICAAKYAYGGPELSCQASHLR